MDPQITATLLKYRFGDFEHMHNHLHVVEGRTLFFYRDPRIRWLPEHGWCWSSPSAPATR